MALSKVTAIGNGSVTDFAVSFALGYISEDHITCQVGDEVDGAGNPVYRPITFLSRELLKVGGAPPGNGVRVVFNRTVPKNGLIINFDDDDVLTNENLDTAQKQAVMMAHEAIDGRFSQFEDDIDLGGFRVTGLGSPNGPTDAVNRGWAETAMTSQLAQAIAAKDIAVNAANDAVANVAATGAAAVQNVRNAEATALGSISSSGNTVLGKIEVEYQRIIQAKNDAVAASDQAVGQAVAAVNYVNGAMGTAVAVITDTKNSAVTQITDTRNEGVGTITTTKTTATTEINATKDSAISLVTAVKEAGVSDILNASNNASAAITALADGVNANVTNGKAEITTAVNTAKTDIQGVSTAATTAITGTRNEAVSTVNTTKTNAITEINAKLSTATKSYPNGPAYTFYDRHGPYVMFDEVAGTDGSAATDTAGMLEALAIAKANANSGVKTTVLVGRMAKITQALNMDQPGVSVFGVSASTQTIFAVATMDALFNITVGGITLNGLSLTNQGNNFTYANKLIRINKPWNNSKMKLSDISLSSATRGIYWDDGDRPWFERIDSNNVGQVLNFRNNGMNGYIDRVGTLGGTLLRIGRNLDGTSARPQQMEGTHFSKLMGIPGAAVNGVNNDKTINISDGLYLTFNQVMVDQLTRGNGIYLGGGTLYDTSWNDIWIGGADSQTNGTLGFLIQGGVDNTKIRSMQIVKCSADGFQCQGGRLRLSDYLGRLNGGADLALNGDTRAKVDCCHFLSTTGGTSVVTTDGTIVRGDFNEFAQGVLLLGKGKWENNYGPGAPNGWNMDAARHPGPGWAWRDGTDIVRVS